MEFLVVTFGIIWLIGIFVGNKDAKERRQLPNESKRRTDYSEAMATSDRITEILIQMEREFQDKLDKKGR